MTAVIAIRTNQWGEEQERLLARLAPVFGDRVRVVFHNRPEGLSLPLRAIDLDEAWVQANGLQLVPDWGWRCGDYFYYRLREAEPDYHYYWLIEPDVCFTSDPAGFFAAFERATEDALGYQPGPFLADNRFARGLGTLKPQRAVFAMTRFSARALDRLFVLRKALSQNGIARRFYPNDELFSFSNVMADPDLTCGGLEAYAADWFEGSQFATDPDLLFERVMRTLPAGRVAHPVRNLDGFKRALGRRLGSNTGMLPAIGDTLAELDATDIDDIVHEAAAQLRLALLAARGPRFRRVKGGA